MTQTASKSVFWTFFSAVMVSSIRFMNTVILARILNPHDFGITGMAVLVTGIVMLFGKLGMGPALIQCKEVDEESLSTVYWTSVLVGGILAVAGVAVSPLAAMFFREPVLVAVISFLALNFIFTSFSSVHATLLTRELKFKALARVEIVSNFFRVGVSFVLALLGFGFWSLVAGVVLERIVKTLLFFREVSWWPKRLFSREKFKSLFRFGRNLYGQSFLGYLNSNMDYAVTGRALGTENLAFYQFSYTIPHMTLSHIAENVDDVTFPLYCKVQDDRERICRGYLKTVKFISLLTFPLMFGLFYVADDFIRVVYGEKWLLSILPLKVLCISGALRSVFSCTGSLLKAIGRPDLGFKYTLFLLPVTVAVVIFGAQWGIIGVAWGMTFTSLLGIVIVVIALRLISASVWLYARTLLPAAVSSLGMVLLLYGLSLAIGANFWPAWVRLATSFLMGILFYVGALWFFFKADFQQIVDFIKQMFVRTKVI